MHTFNWHCSFIRALVHRRYPRKAIRQISQDIQPFFEYIRRVNSHGLTGIESEHVRAYIANVKTACIDTESYNVVYATNDKISAVKMFCLQMFIAGKIPADYACNIGFLPMPAKPPVKE